MLNSHILSINFCFKGIRYAWIIMKITLATLLSRYEFHTDLNMSKLRYRFAISMALVNGHQVRITSRQKPTLKN